MGYIQIGISDRSGVYADTESSFPIELAGVYSTIELDAAHFQLSSTQLDPIPEAFNVKRSIPVYSTKVE